jgi:hypothetical protein
MRAKTRDVTHYCEEGPSVIDRVQTLVRVSQCGIQLHRLAYVLIVEYDWTRRTSFRKRLPIL